MTCCNCKDCNAPLKDPNGPRFMDMELLSHIPETKCETTYDEDENGNVYVGIPNIGRLMVVYRGYNAVHIGCGICAGGLWWSVFSDVRNVWNCNNWEKVKINTRGV